MNLGILLETDYTEGLGALQSFCMNMIMNAFRSSDEIANWLKFDIAWTNTTLGTFQTIYKNFAQLGMMLLLVYFLINMNKTMLMQGNDFGFKTMYVPFFKLAIGYAVIWKGGTIIGTFLGMYNGIIGWATVGNGSNEEQTLYSGVYQTFHDALADMGILETLPLVIITVIVMLTSALASLIMCYQAVSIKLEMLLRAIFAPVSLGDIFNGENSNAIRYLKKMIALILSGAGIILIVKIGTALNLEMLGDMLENADGETLLNDFRAMIQLILIPLAEAGMCGTVKQICNDAVGA